MNQRLINDLLTIFNSVVFVIDVILLGIVIAIKILGI